MFVPGLGAFVRLKQYPASPRADAHVGLAGPIWGLGAALCAKAIAIATGSGVWAAIAEVGALINLFNLLPIGSLDGGRGIRSLTGAQRFALAAIAGIVWAVTHHFLPAMIGILTLLRSLGPDAPDEPDHAGLIRFVVLVLALSALGTSKVQ
jgi:Zn-dependent protease